MNITPDFLTAFVSDLQRHMAVCEEMLGLLTLENMALAGQGNYRSFEFYQKRKNLLPNLESTLIVLRERRLAWQQASPDERERCTEARTLMQNIQNLLLKVLSLDRENQQAMLRRGLVPASHLPAAAAQKPNYVASLYRRNSTL